MVGFFDRIENRLLRMIDWFFARAYQSVPNPARLKTCPVISHRGEHDNRRVFENTLAAFDAAIDQGAWGIEFDMRWTRDLQPVVIHDPDLRRVFGLHRRVADCTLPELQRQCPWLPTLAEVLKRCGGRTHLMVEIKHEPYPEPKRQNQVLSDLFAGLRPGDDFHLLALNPELFRLTPFAPPAACVPVARLNLAALSRLALREGYAGVAGHYLLVTTAIIRRHHAAMQKIGTGYPRSTNQLFRELNRGVDWIFSNRAGYVLQCLRRTQAFQR